MLWAWRLHFGWNSNMSNCLTFATDVGAWDMSLEDATLLTLTLRRIFYNMAT